MFPVPRSGVSELAGIGTKAAFRNRGVASSVVSRLVEHAALRGVALLWLTPEDEAAERIYARSGFARDGGMMVHISMPGAR
jgi:GNAT superfamily N-acetyltransferase